MAAALVPHNPYAAPSVSVEPQDVRHRRFASVLGDLSSAARHIRRACVIATAWALTLGLLNAIEISAIPARRGDILNSALNVVVILLLTFGIAKRSRVCGVLLVAYFFTVIPVVLSLGTLTVVFGPFLAITIYLVGRAVVAMSGSRGL